MDTWFQTKESPGPSRGASPRTPRRLSDGEGLFDTFEEDARWDGADRAPNVLRPPTPVAERATAAPQSPNGSLLHWGSLLGIVAPQPARAVAEGSGGRGQTSDAVLERAAVLVQRLTRGKIARLDAAEVTRRFKLLELYVRCAPRPYAASRLAASRPTPSWTGARRGECRYGHTALPAPPASLPAREGRGKGGGGGAGADCAAIDSPEGRAGVGCLLQPTRGGERSRPHLPAGTYLQTEQRMAALPAAVHVHDGGRRGKGRALPSRQRRGGWRHGGREAAACGEHHCGAYRVVGEVRLDPKPRPRPSPKPTPR